ncbi:MAG: aminotransferase class I/II-fold pyridoxal phosphate-dependent enzyme [bacterium]
MWFNRMPLEDWFDTYQYEIEYDVGESAVKYLSFDELNIDLSKLPLRYGHHRGRPDLREAIACQYDGLSANQVIVTTGASEANFAVLAALLRPGDHVVVHHPNYPSLYEVPRSLGCSVSLLSLEFENSFQLDIEKLKRLITPDTKLISLTVPNNPTGAMISEDTLHEIIRIVESNDTFLLFDETYRELTYGTPLPWAASLSPKIISISSMSKSYGLPGIRIGWMSTQSEAVIEAALAVREQVTIANSAISEEIACSVLEKKEKYLRRAREHVRKNLEIVTQWMSRQESIAWIPPQAGVVCLPKIIKENIADPESVYRLLAETRKTFVIPGRCFEMDNHFFRLGYGGTTKELKAGLEIIESVLRDIR